MIDLEYIGAAEAKMLAQKAFADDTLREELFATMLQGEGREARNAAWTLTHLPRGGTEYINTYRSELVARALTTTESSLRRLSLTLLERLTWEKEDVRTDLLDFCLLHLVNADETYGVRALCAKLAWQQCRHYPELCDELRQTLLILDPTTLKPGLKHTWKKTLNNTQAYADRFRQN